MLKLCAERFRMWDRFRQLIHRHRIAIQTSIEMFSLVMPMCLPSLSTQTTLQPRRNQGCDSLSVCDAAVLEMWMPLINCFWIIKKRSIRWVQRNLSSNSANRLVIVGLIVWLRETLYRKCLPCYRSHDALPKLLYKLFLRRISKYSR